LPAWSVRLIDNLETTDRRVNDLARALSPEQFNWKPTEGRWSIGQCLQHLYAANELYLPAIANALHHQPPSPAEDITPGWFGRWFIRTYIEPSPRGKRARSPKKIAPAQQIDPSVLDLFLKSNDAARERSAHPRCIRDRGEMMTIRSERIYSRRATIGSVREARRAGTRQASAATTMRMIETAAAVEK
jgi:hypothetical protein